MLSADFIEELSKSLNSKVVAHSPLSGGDINEVYLLKTNIGKYVVKVNNDKLYPNMFKKEAAGLKALRKPKVIDIPKVITYGSFKNMSYLLIDFKTNGTKIDQFWEVFGHQLAKLHRVSSTQFGLSEDNYIGSLPQYNGTEQNAVDFYINQRLEPQFKLASENGYSFSKIDLFYTKISHLIPQEPASLIHGDLWSGNFLVNQDGLPCLIDPATAYASREIDIALMHLFGGFDRRLFDAYNDEFPLAEGWRDRIELFQLYHVLVHVNLFGGGYFNQAKAIVKKYIES
ncbi:MAG: fructosamine kinase family protein [Leeuwenhoekiella sp.]